MMNVRCLAFAQEDGMMIYIVVASINVGEYSDFLVGAVLTSNIEQVGGYKIEVTSIPVELLGEVSYAEAVVTKLFRYPR